MATFTSFVSRFKHESESQDNQTNQNNVRKRESSSDLAAAEDSEEGSTSSSLAFRTRKSLRLSTPHPNARPSNSRVIGADCIKSRPHYKREPVVKAIKKEKVKRALKSQGCNTGYSAPEVYAHLNLLPDIIDYDLDVLFVGINPGVRSSERRHHFAGPTNHFWPCLSDSGLLPPGVKMGPDDDASLPAVANMGLTNLVDRPSRMGNELSVAECRAAAPVLTAKIKKYRPRFVCFVSKQAWDMFSGVGLGLQTAWLSWYDEEEDHAVLSPDDDKSHAIQNNLDSQGYRLAPYLEDGPAPAKLEHDLANEGVPSPFIKHENTETVKQEPTGPISSLADVRVKSEVPEDIKPLKVKEETQEQKIQGRPKRTLNRGVRGSRMFVMPSTSGRVTQYRKEDKLAYFRQLAELVRRDRQIRGL
ncbi:thymine-DNA glycosylase [Entomortierella parvispora]|uniref:Thymine-DNA glycosylase n=1 Tax=Entomortierella parvispora TaxID=205924 RepID=A0A9P3H2K1_9FUNG|nr:thymine-DNA glycosylase [Entomortierella parvispora]